MKATDQVTGINKSVVTPDSFGVLKLWPILIIALAIAVSFKSILYCSLVFIAGLTVQKLLDIRRSGSAIQVRFDVVDIIISLGVAIEILAYFFSTQRLNSNPFLLMVLNAIATYYFIKVTVGRTKALIPAISILMALFAGYWTVVTLLNLGEVAGSSLSIGFQDITLFRNSIAPLVGSNEWVVFLFLLMPFSTALALGARGWVARSIGFVSGLLLMICVILSFSRGGYLGLFLYAAGLCLTVGVYKLIGRRMVVWSLSGIALVVLGVGVLQWEAVKSTLLMNESVSQVRSTESRFRMWDVATEVWKERPVFGSGIGNFALEYNAKHRRDIDEAPFGRVTSVLTQLVAEKGVLGLAVPLGLMLLLSWYGLKYLRRRQERNAVELLFVVSALALIPALLIRELTMSTILHQKFIYQLFIVLYACLGVLSIRQEDGWKCTVPAAVVLVAPILGLLLMIGQMKLGERVMKPQLRKADVVIQKGSDRSNIADNSKLVRMGEYHPVPLIDLAAMTTKCAAIDWGTLFQCDGEPGLSISYLDRALKVESRDETILFAKGFYLAVEGKWDEAIDVLRQAHELDMSQSIYALILGIVYEKKDGNVDVALKYYAHALALDPDLCLSPFFEQFKERHASGSDRAFGLAIELLRKQSQSPVNRARLGACLFFSNQYRKAEEMLDGASQDLPGMNRPYFYRGAIALAEGDTSRAMVLWDKAYYLDPGDKLLNDSYLQLSDAVNTPSWVVLSDKGYNLDEPFYGKRQGFYQRFAPVSNTVLTQEFMRYVTPISRPWSNGSLSR